MRTSGRLLLTAALLLCAACSSEDVEVPPAGLAETYDVVIANDLVFVTSAETNDLRVIRPADTDYVRAPNPLEALSIPVVARPDKLARDVSYDAPDPEGDGSPATGVEVTGPYIYVRSASEPNISVVSTASLREVARIPTLTPGTAGAVTAFAARGPTKSDPAHSELYFATQTQGRSTLLRVRIPADPAALTDEVKATLVGVPLPFVATAEPPPEGKAPVTVPAEGYGPIVALAVLPGNQLAMAARGFNGTPARPFANVLLQMDEAQATVMRRLVFTIPTAADPDAPGTRREVPVRALLTHGLIERPGDTTGNRAAGDRIFGLIDETACTDLRRCGGVLAVQSATGDLALARVDALRNAEGVEVAPAFERPMLPLAFDDSLPTGFTLAPGATLRFTEGTIDVTRKQLHVGIVAHASGQYFFFDAEKLLHYDRNAATSTSRFDGLFTASGAVKGGAPLTNNPVSVEVREGYAELETLSVIFESLVTPNFFSIPPGTQALTVPPAVEVLPGDLVRFYSSASGASVCLENGAATEVPVASVTNGTITLAGDGSIPAACAGSLYFQVVAGASSVKPWVVYDGTVFLGRAGQTTNALELFAPPRFLAPGFSPGPRLRVSLSSQAVQGTNRGDRYVYAINPAFDPFNFTVATEIPRLERFFIPGPLIYSQGVFVEVPGAPEPELTGDNRIYVVYPTADGVLQVALELVRNGAREAVPVVPFQ